MTVGEFKLLLENAKDEMDINFDFPDHDTFLRIDRLAIDYPYDDTPPSTTVHFFSVKDVEADEN